MTLAATVQVCRRELVELKNLSKHHEKDHHNLC